MYVTSCGGAFSGEGEKKLKYICAGKTPCGVGTVNGHKVKVMRDSDFNHMCC